MATAGGDRKRSNVFTVGGSINATMGQPFAEGYDFGEGIVTAEEKPPEPKADPADIFGGIADIIKSLNPLTQTIVTTAAAKGQQERALAAQAAKAQIVPGMPGIIQTPIGNSPQWVYLGIPAGVIAINLINRRKRRRR